MTLGEPSLYKSTFSLSKPFKSHPDLWILFTQTLDFQKNQRHKKDSDLLQTSDLGQLFQPQSYWRLEEKLLF